VSEAECQRRIDVEKAAGTWQAVGIGVASAVAGALASFALTRLVK
jgi:hypothetical protein